MAGLLDFLQSASNTAASNVSAPVDGIAWLLRKAGVPVDAPIGGSDWMAQKGLTRPVQQSGASLAGETLGLLAPIVAAAKAPQIAGGLLQMGENASIPAELNRQAGMIRAPFGRIPETLDERMQLRSLLEKNAISSGYEVTNDAATSGASLYSTITNPKTGKEAVVRISDHSPAMKYVPSNTPYFSVSPDQGVMTNGGTFEQAVSWLGRQGLPIKNLGARYDSAIASETARQQAAAEALRKEIIDAQMALNAKTQAAFDSGQKYIIESTKINSGGRRYNVKTPDGKSYTAYSKNIPDEFKAGDRDGLVNYIINNFNPV